jgi:hypothetical protein
MTACNFSCSDSMATMTKRLRGDKPPARNTSSEETSCWRRETFGTARRSRMTAATWSARCTWSTLRIVPSSTNGSRPNRMSSDAFGRRSKFGHATRETHGSSTARESSSSHAKAEPDSGLLHGSRKSEFGVGEYADVKVARVPIRTFTAAHVGIDRKGKCPNGVSSCNFFLQVSEQL